MIIAICTKDDLNIGDFSESHIILIDTDNNSRENETYLKAIGLCDIIVSSHFDGFAVTNITESGVTPLAHRGTIEEAIELCKNSGITRTKPKITDPQAHIGCGGGCGI